MSDELANRRADDARIANLEQRMGHLEGSMTRVEHKLDNNNADTKEVLDTLRAFKMMAGIAKWSTVVGGAVVGGYHAMQQFFHK